MANKRYGLGILVVVLVFGVTIVGCNNSSTDTKEIDSIFRGKWECQSVVLEGVTYTLPCTISGTYYNSIGYEVSTTSVIMYANEVVKKNSVGVYSQENSFYDSDGKLTPRSSGKWK